MLSQGTKLSISTDGTTWTEVGCVTSYSLERSERNTIETTCLNSSEKTFAMGLKDPGSLNFDLEYEQEGAGQGMLEDSYNSDVAYHFQIEYNNGETGGTNGNKTFEGFVSSISESGSVDDLLTESVTVQITGEVVNTDPVPAP